MAASTPTITVAICIQRQIAEVILHLAIPIISATVCPEKYWALWHTTIDEDIEGIKSMLVHLERAYEKIFGTIHERPTPPLAAPYQMGKFAIKYVNI
jgi:hypothetical protein